MSWMFTKRIQQKQQYFIMRTLILFTLLSAFCIAILSKRLVFIECITRHGVRYPSFPNPYDYSNISSIQNAKSQLTNEGRHMHFVLGRLLFKKYWNQLFPNTTKTKFNNSLIYAKSTNTNRTIESLQNLLLGFFAEIQKDQLPFAQGAEISPPFKMGQQEELEEEWSQFWLKQRTIPIHVQKGAGGDPGIANSFNEGDFLVKQEYNLCPNQQTWEQDNLNSDIVSKIMNSTPILKAVQRLRPYFGDLPLDFNNLYKVVDNYNCLKAMGRPYIHIFQDPQIATYLQFTRIARLYVIYLYSQQQIKTFAHGLLAATIYNFKRAVANKGPRIVFYSGHDITIGILLASLNLTNIDCLFQSYIQQKPVANCYLQYPQFASSFIFQLWEENNVYSIEISINGQQYKIPICNLSSSCRLQNFETWFKNTTIENSPNEQCGVPSVKSYKVYIQMAIVFSLGVAIPIVLYFCFVNRRKSQQEHIPNSRLRMEDDLE